jgi:hypothetical protein
MNLVAGLAILFVFWIMVLAFCHGEGLWGNSIIFVNLALASLAAGNLFEPLAALIEGFIPDGSHYWDFVTFWLVFIFSYLILRVFTDLRSRMKVRFPTVIDVIGMFGMASINAWIVFCMFSFSLHLGPLPVELPSVGGAGEGTTVSFYLYENKGMMGRYMSPFGSFIGNDLNKDILFQYRNKRGMYR